jgi:hypothetical protein
MVIDVLPVASPITPPVKHEINYSTATKKPQIIAAFAGKSCANKMMHIVALLSGTIYFVTQVIWFIIYSSNYFLRIADLSYSHI